MNIRIGHGFDVHAFARDRRLVIGGVDIPHDRGLLGHSDADVLIHAICDALLGAAGLGDIGRHFPDSDARYKGIDSRELLRHVAGLLEQQGWKVGNVDATIIAQAPRMAAPYSRHAGEPGRRSGHRGRQREREGHHHGKTGFHRTGGGHRRRGGLPDPGRSESDAGQSGSSSPSGPIRDVRARLHLETQRLHRLLGGRPTHPDSLHLTLVFVGEVDNATFAGSGQCVGAGEMPPFRDGVRPAGMLAPQPYRPSWCRPAA
jgi:2-C-methyl-D-erythritol 2,4-cyclodiphosphate synthase